MIIFVSHNGVPVRMSAERWSHIVCRHPELDGQQKKLVETLSEPGYIQKGDFGTMMAIRHYPQTPLTEKYMIVIYKEVSPFDGYVLTAYFATRYSKRRTMLWKR